MTHEHKWSAGALVHCTACGRIRTDGQDPGTCSGTPGVPGAVPVFTVIAVESDGPEHVRLICVPREEQE